jgi:hypothetical protein
MRARHLRFLDLAGLKEAHRLIPVPRLKALVFLFQITHHFRGGLGYSALTRCYPGNPRQGFASSIANRQRARLWRADALDPRSSRSKVLLLQFAIINHQFLRLLCNAS